MITYCSIIENKEENAQYNMGVVLFNKREDAHFAVRNMNDTVLPGDNSDTKIQLSM